MDIQVDDLILKTKIHGKIRANVATKDHFFILIYFRNQNIDAKRNRISRSYHICIHFMFQFVKNFPRRSGVNNEILHSTFYTLEREIDWRVK